MKKVLGLIIVAALILVVPVVGFAHTAADPYEKPLIAGGGNVNSAIRVGDVRVWNDEDYLYVKYVITNADWCITDTHLAVAPTLDGIPQTKKGNPIPGQFDYSSAHECLSEYTYQIDLTWNPDTKLRIATHAVVQTITGYSFDIFGFEAGLSGTVTMSVQYPYEGGPAYFPATTISGDPITGAYYGWCVDTDHVISQNINYTANVYSSYETLPAGLVEFPQNLDLVNWIINQGYVGQPSACDGNYTYGDVQRAIWELIDDTPATSGLGSWDQCRVDEIRAAAQTNGEGYIPACRDNIAVLLAPVDGSQVIIAQVILAELNLGCVPIYSSETAWGGTCDFPGKNWATFLKYTVQGHVPQ